MKTKIANYSLTALFLLISLFSYAQKKPGFMPPSIDDEEIPVVKTELPVPEEGKDYVVKYFKGITDGVESRIAVKKLGYIIRPAMVQVISEDGRELAIELVKKNWDDVVRSGKTKDGNFESSFKTAMEFGIKISAKEMGIPFIVAVSAGVELFPVSNLFVDAGTMRSGDGNKEMSTTNETELMGQESGQSNTILFIIIALALVGILALLAVLVFKKKGKGAATLLLLMMVLPLSAGIVPTDIELLGGLAENLVKGLGNHYGKGGFNGDDPLSEDDKEHEPEVDPRGQPSLPSSCYEITRMGRQGGSGGSGSNMDGPNGTKNPDNAGDGPTRTLGGGMAGGISGGDAGEDVGHEDGKDRDYEKERQKLNENYQRDLEEVENVYEWGKIDAEDNYNQSIREASKQLDRDVENANGDTELMAQASANNATTVAQLSTTLATTNAQLSIDYSVEVADLGVRLADGLSALLQEESSQQNNEGGEKDPNREPKKDPDREEGKSIDNGGTDKGVDSPDDSGNLDDNRAAEERERNREKEEGCNCLEAAYADLLKQRYSLEKLLKIGQHTKKVTDFGISFGDDFSGVHGVSGLVWQTQRAKVLKSIDKFDITYNNKYKELIDKLYNALIKIDECENQLGYENWYSQSGFIYYEFMKVRYAHYK